MPQVNPFRTAPGSQPPLLAGRDAEQELIAAAVALTAAGAPARPIILTGLRGVGKTALLRHALKDARANKAIVVYAEGSQYRSLATAFRESLEQAEKQHASLSHRLKEVTRTALAVIPQATIELPDHLGSIGLQGKAPAKETLLSALRDLNEAVRREGRCLVIAIDEIQITSHAELEPIIDLVHLSSDGDNPILFLGAGLPNSKAHLKKAKTYTERWRYARLELLGTDDTARAIREPLLKAKIDIDDDALDVLVANSDGYPFFIQEYGSAAWTLGAKKHITREAVEGILPAVKSELDSSLYDAVFEPLTAKELRYVFALVDAGAGPRRVGDIAGRLGGTAESMNWIRNQLIKKDVIYSPGTGLVEFRLPLTRQYVARHRAALRRRVEQAARG